MKRNLLLPFFALLIVSHVSIAQERTVRFPFSVLDSNGQFFGKLTNKDITAEVESSKAPIEIRSLTVKTDVPLDVLLLVDASVSQQRVLPQAKQIAASFTSEVLKPDRDRVAVAKFSSTISLLQDLSNDLSNASQQLASISAEVPTGFIGGGIVTTGRRPNPNSPLSVAGSTTIWDSLKHASDALSHADRAGSRKLIVLFSDGVNTYGESKLKEAINTAVKNGTPIYAVGIGDDFYSGVDEKSLIKLSRDSNGIAFFPKSSSASLATILRHLEQPMRNFYEIELVFAPAGKPQPLYALKLETSRPASNGLQIIKPRGIALAN
jgi:VWFA-related protein